MSNNANDEIMKLYEYLVKEQQLTPTAVQRALTLYQKVVQVMDKYKAGLIDPSNRPNVLMEMDKEILTLLGKEIDSNFYEGMMDATMKSLISVMKIPQVQEISKQFAIDVASKSPNGGSLKDLIKKAFKGDDSKETTTTEKGSSAMDSILDSLGVTPGKDRLN
jgi:hypothetical protein